MSQIQVDDRCARIGYWIGPRSRGRGFATAALRLLSEWAFGPPLRLERLELLLTAENLAARRAAERAGYELDALLRSYMALKGRRWDVTLYSLIAPLQ